MSNPIKQSIDRPKTRITTTRILSFWKIIGVILLLGVVAVLWVRKENWHEQLARQVLVMERTEDSLRTQAGHLRQQYLTLTDPSRIERMARHDLNMVFPKIYCDTIWVQSSIDDPFLEGDE